MDKKDSSLTRVVPLVDFLRRRLERAVRGPDAQNNPLS